MLVGRSVVENSKRSTDRPFSHIKRHCDSAKGQRYSGSEEEQVKVSLTG
jgi:hypothetical protein